MLAWISENIGTIVISFLLCAVIARIVVGMIKDRKKGKSSCCGGSCGHCGMGSACHKHGCTKIDLPSCSLHKK